ncbi:hypothetical protein E0Z10_g2202 [Xylaria hypoxylon]|uniref:Uncharacterized protein n=1 Tax=Xylaria hypoxylon TaxID=37992 RepID=A0A4Z0Z6R8_9PEZI|nr:hypothetical protein E0Z10_g2202 [Xylaria hypoxylon]
MARRGSQNCDAIILVYFIHRRCNKEYCEANDAVNFGDYVNGILRLDDDIMSTITAAAKDHVATAHRHKHTDVKLSSATFMWERSGKYTKVGSDLLKMDEDKRCDQLKLALQRGHVDYLEVEFTSKAVPKNSTASTN